MAHLPPDPNRLHVGRVARAHGLRGELRLSTFDHDAPSLRVGIALVIQPARASARTHPVTGLRRVPDGILVTLDGVTDRTGAEALEGADVFVSRADLPALGGDEAWAFELEGCRVTDADGRELGTVEGVSQSPAHDLLVVRATGGALVEVPMVPALLARVDTAERTVVLTPIPGLFDDDAVE